jgi:hypothetical protein
VGYVERTLADGERVLCRGRLHWIIYLRSAVLGILGVVAIASSQLAANDAVFALWARSFGALLLLLVPLAALGATVEVLTTEIAATTRRFVVKRGLIRRAVMEINAGQLESISIYQTLFGRLLGYGTLIVGGTGSGIDPVKNVAAPLLLREAISRIGRDAPAQQFEDRVVRPSEGGAAAVIIGDGKYAFPVVGESHHEVILDQLVGGRSEEGAHQRCAALLVPQPDHPYDPDAIAVSIRGHEVGFLPRNVAGEFLAALRAGGFGRAACEAVIVGGWDRGEGDRGNFGVRLNACRPFRLQSAEDWARRKRG